MTNQQGGLDPRLLAIEMILRRDMNRVEYRQNDEGDWDFWMLIDGTYTDGASEFIDVPDAAWWSRACP